jgi:secreted Zn-dependent insulinase-like peptidase
MGNSEFERLKNNLRTTEYAKPAQLGELGRTYWLEIKNRLYNFNRDEMEVKQLLSLTVNDLLTFFRVSVDYLRLVQ